MKDIKVNLFIVGAAKSATTSLYNYLSYHPEVFFPKLKEPRFFSSKYYSFPHNGTMDAECTDRFIVKTLSDYEKLYSNSKGEKIIGDASVDYLYTLQAANDIYKYNPQAKIIIILRNPIDRAFSHYNHLVRDGREKCSFIEGLNLEEKRKEKNFEFSWHYTSVGMYYEQVNAYLKYFKKEQVLILLFEELVSTPKPHCKRITEFLGIDIKSIESNLFPIINKTGIPKSQFVTDIINRPSFFKSILKKLIPHRIGIKVKSFLNGISLYQKVFYSDNASFLEEKFKNDILKLEKLISRDLSDIWNMNLRR